MVCCRVMRATGNDLCELFGYAPDDLSDAAADPWRTRECPFAGGLCIKHSHPQGSDPPIILGSCSVTNRLSTKTTEDVIICPQRLYANNYAALRACAQDAGIVAPAYLAAEYASLKKNRALPCVTARLLRVPW